MNIFGRGRILRNLCVCGWVLLVNKYESIKISHNVTQKFDDSFGAKEKQKNRKVPKKL